QTEFRDAIAWSLLSDQHCLIAPGIADATGHNVCCNGAVALFGLAAGQVWNVNMTFGSSDDELDLVSFVPGNALTGRVDAGGRIPGNVFNEAPGWTFLPPFQLANFP